MTLSYENMHVYRSYLRGVFRNVKKTVLKAQFYIAFPAKAPIALHMYRKRKKCAWSRRIFFFFCRSARLLELLQETRFTSGVLKKSCLLSKLLLKIDEKCIDSFEIYILLYSVRCLHSSVVEQWTWKVLSSSSVGSNPS